MPKEKTFAEIVSSFLKESGMTTRAFSDEFECAPSTITRWANGTAEPMPGVKKYAIRWMNKKLNDKNV